MKTVRRTLMPALWAERREPPTASTCQPGRDRVSATWAMMREHDRRQHRDREAVERAVADEIPDVGGSDESWICAAKSTTRMSNSARPMMKVTSVVRKARSRI